MPDAGAEVTSTVSLELGLAAGRVRNLRPLFLGVIYPDLLATERAIFANAGGVAGVARWEPLSEATVARKTAQGGMSTRLLVERGDLERSLIEPNAPGQVARMEGENAFVFGTEVTNDRGQQFAPYHMLGTRNMPARPFMPDEWPEEDVERWADLAVEYIMEGRL